MSSEKKRLMILISLLAVAAGVWVLDRFVLSNDGASDASTTNVARATSAQKSTSSANHPLSGRKPSAPEPEQGYRPLPLGALRGGSGVRKEASRNVFVYYVPPPIPPKPIPPPPPPPLTITSLDPRSVYAKTKDFTLRVMGANLPEDAQIFINGRMIKTVRVSASELTATVDRRMFAAPGQLQVDVKNQAGDLYSNTLSVVIQEPPAPIYKYIGRIDNLVYLQKSSEERLIARLGSTVENRWKIAEIRGEDVVLKDTVLDIPYTIPLENTGNPGMSGVQADGNVIQTGVSPRRGRMPKGAVEPQQPEQTSEEEEP